MVPGVEVETKGTKALAKICLDTLPADICCRELVS